MGLLEYVSQLHAKTTAGQGAVELAEYAGVGEVLDLGGEVEAVVEEAVLEAEVDGGAAGDASLIGGHLEVEEVLLHEGEIREEARVLAASAEEVLPVELKAGVAHEVGDVGHA